MGASIEKPTENWRWVVLSASAPAVWGTTYIVTTQFLPPGYPIWSSVLRALPAGIIGLLICKQLPRGEWIWRSLIMAILNIGLWFPLLFVAAYRLPGGMASVLSACQPLFVIAFAWVLLYQSPSIWRVAWAIAGVVGVAVMVLASDSIFDPLGITAGILGTVSMALGIVMTKKWQRPTDGFTWAAWLLAWGGLLQLPMAILFEGTPPPQDLRSILGYAWLSIAGGLLTYWAWFTGLGKISAVSASFLPLLSPLVATLLGYLLLDELLTLPQWFGFLLCLTAIVLSQIAPPWGAAQTSLRGATRR
ncbi:putative inner membrane transporter YedA [Corynebacterium glaucum]|uniref:Putative inner membrane transporter YedA n=1 Tax=Corynebacterium glaucum TaxID=187491 RepID=A0A1Q2HYM6_9CORY|nr:EamA family transporter [Corynebacterium glaucum]AQQ15948.1 putative inner membrane transporter YedA [Corynebacterium glaucum]WJZ08431.1 putative inner membrane transporter YedA [Corynebacterium glaucum]